MDLYATPNPNDTGERQKGVKLRQTSINDAYDKEVRPRIIQYISQLSYQAGIAFNTSRFDSFKTMVQAIGRYGPNLKPPSYYELKVPFTQKRGRAYK